MGAVERIRERTLEQLGDAYAGQMIDTRSLEWRVDAALRSGTPAGLRETVWDLPSPTDRLRVLAARARWCSDALLGREHPYRHVALIDLVRIAGDAARGRWTIGRSRSCDITLKLSGFLSSRHAELSLRDGVWRLRDLRSTNGTWIGGHRVGTLLVDPRVPVVLGDVQVRWV